ncbi:hypothetical protein HY78_13965 [Rhizorhabdus wittichii DC-6]|nr:hypothetical protein HY78_13965 [Rhizorhabdus wittichii DC-6]
MSPEAQIKSGTSGETRVKGGGARGVPSHADCVAMAEELAPRLAPFVDEAERSRRVPKGAADALIASGLMPLVRPARHGGYEHGWMAYADVLAPIARQSGSLAWVLGFLLHHQWALGFFPQATQDEVYSQAADPCIASMFAPSGRATAKGSKLRLTGEWSFSSGIDNCDWVMLAGFAEIAPGEPPINCWFLLKPGQFEVRDTWHAVGLSGTGSNNVVVRDALIDADYWVRADPFGGDDMSARSGNRGIRFVTPPVGQFQYGLVAPMIGIAMALHEEVLRFNAGRQGLLIPGKIADDPFLQAGLGESEAELAAAYAAMSKLDDAIAAGEMRTPDGIARFRAGMGFVAKTITAASERLFYLSGGRGLDSRKPLSRHWRDLHAITNHAALKYEMMFQGLGQAALARVS